ncbi:MAG: response regulator [Alphaproteobacteria bacterium]|nr:response regulator [Alphaproteobacteria bacterium SS10]
MSRKSLLAVGFMALAALIGLLLGAKFGLGIAWQTGFEMPEVIQANSKVIKGALVASLLLIMAIGMANLKSADADSEAAGSKNALDEKTRMRLIESILHNTSDAVVITSTDLDDPIGPRILLTNRAYQSMSGYSEDELRNQPIPLFTEQGMDAEECMHLRDALSMGETYRTEMVFYRRDNQQLWMDVEVFPLLDSSGKATNFAAFARDIGAQKEIRSELESAKEAAEAANRLKSEFLATMSHEIRTPLNGIVGMTNLLLDTMLNHHQRNHVDMLAKSADTLLNLINDILDLSKIEAGRLEIEALSFNLKNLVLELVSMVQDGATKKGVELIVDIDPNLPMMIESDPGRVRQVLLNLMSNAIKFTDEGHVLLRVERAGQVDNDDVKINVTVQDSGVGIAPEKREIIFDKFSQADSSTTRRFGGTGLGLTISRQLTKLLGGDLALGELPASGGSTFCMSFIGHHPDGQTIGQVLRSQSQGALVDRNILIIDDPPESATAIAKMVEGLGAQSITMEDLIDLPQIAKRHRHKESRWDLIIVDERLSFSSAFEIYGKLEESFGSNIPPILLIAEDPIHNRIGRLRECHFGGAIERPIRPSNLVRGAAHLIQGQNDGVFWTATNTYTRNSQSEKTNRHDEPAPLTGLQVLLAEDNPINAQIFVHVLERWGARVTVAGNGVEAIEIATSMPLDIIFMDCQMPELDGYEATQKLREMMDSEVLTKTPIIALTANAMKGDRERCLAAGMDDYLSKPAQPRDIAAMIRRWWSEPEEDAGAEPAQETLVAKTDLKDQSRLIDQQIYEDCADILGPKHAEVITDFVDRLSAMLQTLAFAYEGENFQAMAKLVHPFKSSAAQIGAVAISEQCRRIETATRDKKPDEIDHDSLTTTLVELREVSEESGTLLRSMVHQAAQRPDHGNAISMPA